MKPDKMSEPIKKMTSKKNPHAQDPHNPIRNESNLLYSYDEKWIRIKDFPNYFVSSMGRIFFIKNDRAYISIAKRTDYYGYLKVFLKNENKIQGFKMHRLVLMAFTNKWETEKIVCHKNDIKTDNRLENLYWGTPAQNTADKLRNNPSALGEKHWSAKLTKDDVLYIREHYKRESYHKSNSRELAEKFGVDKANIIAIIKGKVWKHVL